jgi:cobalt/nickel transport system permease protein
VSKIMDSLHNIRLLDDLGKQDTFIHRLHPLTKLLTTVIYLTVVVSFDRYAVGPLLSFVFYPVFVLAWAELPLLAILKSILLVEPLILTIGILNPLFDHNTILVGKTVISMGWITFLSIVIKGSITVTVGVLLLATTGIEKLATALRIIKIPQIFVLQLLLTYRYISVLIEEVYRMIRAYLLRAPGQKGIQRSMWGSFAGLLLLRTYDRAQLVYQAMNLRGFTGEYHSGDIAKVGFYDIVFLLIWSVFFIMARIYNIPMLIGLFCQGVFGQ